MKKLLVLFVALFAISSMSNIYAFDFKIEAETDSCNDDKWDFKDWVKYRKATFEALYIFSNASYSEKAFPGKFAKQAGVEIRLGHNGIRSLLEEPSIVKHDYTYFFVSNINPNFGMKRKDTTEVEFESWRFGFANSDGYGYKTGDNSALLFYHSMSINWNKLQFFQKFFNTTGVPLPKSDSLARPSPAIDVFGDQLRLGNSFEGGIRFVVFENLAITAGYERQIIYPRNMFWYWLGSGFIEGVAHGITDFI